MVIAFALAAAVLYGSADFLGGAASRRVRAQSVVVISVPAGAALMLLAALLSGAPFQLGGLGWPVAAGAVGGAGLIVFYAGLAAGPMMVVAPVSALVSTVLPVGVALAAGERASLAVYAGAVACVVAIGLVSMEAGPPGGPASPAGPGKQPGQRHPGRLLATRAWALSRRRAAARGLGYGIASGIAFGMFFLFLRNAGGSGVLWPVCVAKAAGSATVLAAAAWRRVRPPLPPEQARVLLAALGAGLLDAGANVCYLLAARAGLFGVAVVITSLYPGVTVLLARAALGERMRGLQRAGLLLAAAGVALVTF